MTRSDASPGFQVGPDTTLRLDYRVFDAEGDLVEDARERTVVFGYGALLPAIERALEGCSAGAKRSLSLAPREAFGTRRADRIIDVDRDEFPADAQAGDRYLAETDGGEPLVLSLLELDDECARVDTNHPLAGQTIRVELEVIDVRPATTTEIEAVRLRVAAALGPEEPLIAPERLLRGATRRYDNSADAATAHSEQSETLGDPIAPSAVRAPDKPKIA